MNTPESATHEWLSSGQVAVAMITSSLHHPDMTEDSYGAEVAAILSDLTPCQLALVVTWLARTSATAILENAGSKDDAEAQLREMGSLLATESVTARE